MKFANILFVPTCPLVEVTQIRNTFQTENKSLNNYSQEWHYGNHAKVLWDGPGEQRDENENIEK